MYKHIIAPRLPISSSLNLNKENDEDSKANVLDLSVSTVYRMGILKLMYMINVTNDEFPFQIVQISGKDSNIPRSTTLGVFQSQVIRYIHHCCLSSGRNTNNLASYCV